MLRKIKNIINSNDTLRTFMQPLRIMKRKMIEFKMREVRKSFGSSNPEKNIYIIRRSDSNCGLFSYFITVMGHLKIAEEKGYIPVVDMQNYENTYLYKNELGKVNSWEYYFEPVSNVSIEEAYHSKNVILSDSGIPNVIPEGTIGSLMNEEGVMDEWRKLFREYIHLKKDVKAKKIEIIIVDSGSEDDTLKIAKQFNCRIIKIPPEDFTWGFALNIGIENAQGEFIGIISGHCILTKDNFVLKSVEILKNNEMIAAVYGRQVGMHDMDPFEEVDLNYHYPERDLDVFYGEWENAIGVSNACCVLKKSVWNIIKFDEMAQSCEDGIWAKKILKLGYSIAYTSEIGTYHSHKLNSEYLYKKYYWREYCPEYNKLHIHNKIYNFLKFMIKKNFSEYRFYASGFKKLRIICPKKYIFYYILIRNLAMMNASNDLANHAMDSIKYENIIVPSHIVQIQNKLGREQFWYYN